MACQCAQTTQRPVFHVILDSNGMNLLTPSRRFDPKYPELIDRPGTDRALLREELQMLEKTNRRLGGHQLMLQYLGRLLGQNRITSLRILDLGTGLADIPRAIAGWARQRQVPITIVAVDGNPVVLQMARESCRDWSEIQLEQHDLLALPFASDSFDLVLCSLTLHHFSSADAVAILRRIHEMARLGYIVNDLRRNWLAVCSMELLARTVIRSHIVRHDAPQSSRAAFTIHELRDMASQAGLTNFQINRHHAVFRMVLVGRK
jgi:SAM-dependent methyltransferase